MAADDSSHDRNVKDKGEFEESLRRYLKRADRRSPLPDGFLERLQRDTPTKPAPPTVVPSLAASTTAAPHDATGPQPGTPPHTSLWQGASLKGVILQDRYLVEERVSKGGMSWVYRGNHTHLNTPIAIKVLFPELVEEATCRKRFFDEARALSLLDHPHIVRVFDVFAERGLVGMALEWIEGDDLYTWFSQRGTPLALSQIAALFAPLLDALEAIHDAGMIHRDLKPDNILLDLTGPTPQPKIADFGLVRAEGARSGARTQTGARLGTPLYMSPEQIKDSKSADARADLYSLGAILYELLLGHPPFEGDEQWLLLQQLHAPPTPPEERWHQIPPVLATLLCKALAKEPAERFQSCAAFREALLPCLHTHSALTPTWQTPPPKDPSWQLGILQSVEQRSAKTVALPPSPWRWLGPVLATSAIVALAIIAWFALPLATHRPHTKGQTPPHFGTAKTKPARARLTPPIAPRGQKPPQPIQAARQPPSPRQHRPKAWHPKRKYSRKTRRKYGLRRPIRQRKRRMVPRPRPVKPQAAVFMTLRLTTQPKGAVVWINGKRLPGTTPLKFRVVAGQSIHVRLVRPGYKPKATRWSPSRTHPHKTFALTPASPKTEKTLKNWNGRP